MYFGDNNGKARKASKIYVGAPLVRMKNLIPAINGANGWSNGTASTVHTKYSTQSLLLTGATNVAETVTQTTKAIPMIAGHKYYIRTEIYFSSSTVQAARRSSCYWPIAEPNVWNTRTLGLTLGAEQWILLGMISDRGAAGFTSGDYELRVDFDNDNKAGQMWVDGVMCIDLTAAFGAGNEPSQEWCNTIPYFVGEQDIIYTGTTSKARRVTKIYKGDASGKARLCWSLQKELMYAGTATPLSQARAQLAATTVGGYALFGGGTNGSAKGTVDAYNTSLTRSAPASSLSVIGLYDLSATTVGDYAIFYGGTDHGTTASVFAYDKLLTKKTPTPVKYMPIRSSAATTVGNYALFGGGILSGSSVTEITSAFNDSFTQTAADFLSVARSDLAATTIGNYALFGGGQGVSSPVATVDAYNSSLTRSTPTSLENARYSLVSASVGDYAIFYGGLTSYPSALFITVEAYDKSLTKKTISPVRYIQIEGAAATSIGDYALFGGGLYATGALFPATLVYDASLTSISSTDLARSHLAATTVGNYAIFAGGENESGYSDAVDVYTIS